jgi:tetratricopeptide (TPR) repeat protein
MAGREDDALSACEKALSLCPSYYEAYLNRGLLHSRLGNGKAAEKDFLAVLDIKPEEYRAEFALGNLYLAKRFSYTYCWSSSFKVGWTH